jgi:predicted MFS family arabinose efflux permease
MSLKSKMPLQVWILTLSAFAIGTAEFVIAGVLPQVASAFGAGAVSFAAALLPLVALVFILTQERGRGVGPVQTRVVADPTIL